MNVARIELFVLISSIESDLRNFAKENLLNSFLEDEGVFSEAKKRYVKEIGEYPKESSQLIDFLNFGDTYQILLAKKEELGGDIRKELVKHRATLESITLIRNRVMHSRPLEADDYYTVTKFARLVSKGLWPECEDAFRKINEESPDHFLNQVIPRRKNEGKVIHNLPDPDFDETGFIGRKEDIDRIKKRLTSREHDRIITLYGEGGIGKTAVMLKTAYDIIDDEECQFEWVIWITCKTTVLTNNGIKEINGAISSFKSAAHEIDDKFREVPETATLKETIDSILDSMNQVRTLLILDNLETLQSEQEMMDFLDECKEVGKIAITSRIALGKFDNPIQLRPMKEKEAEKLLRDFARFLNIELLYSLSKEKIQEYIGNLFLNPLWIKWFVQAVASGSTPSEVFSNKNKDTLLDYCLSNVYKKLNEEQKAFLHIILANGKPTSKEELLFYSEGKDEINATDSLRKLVSTSFIKIEDNSYYDITDFARAYILTKDPPNEKFYEEIKKKQNIVDGLREKLKTQSKSPYNEEYIDIRKDSESILAVKLAEALRNCAKAKEAKKGKNRNKVAELYEKALKKVSEVKEIQPSYYEAYRVAAFIYVEQRNYSAARDEYRKALEMEPKNPRVNYFYAGFLQRQLKNMEEAKKHAEIAVCADGESFYTRWFYATCIGRQGDFDKAIKMLREVMNKKCTRREKLIVATLIIGFYKNKVERKRYREKDCPEAWNVFAEAVDFYESLKEINPDDRMKKKFVGLLNEGSRCIQDDEQRDSEFNKLKSRYTTLIYDFDPRGYLLRGKQLR